MTILDKLKAEHHDVNGIKDARNITEAVARIHGVTGPAAGGAIADYIYETWTVKIKVNGSADGAFKDGASQRVLKVKKGSTLVLPTEDDLILPTNKEYLDKWYLLDEGSPVGVHVATPSVQVTNNCTISAVYGDSLTIYFDPNGGSGNIEPTVIKPLGSSFSVFFPGGNDLTHPEGKTFVGWGDTPSTPANQVYAPYDGYTEAIPSGTKPNTKIYYAIWQ